MRLTILTLAQHVYTSEPGGQLNIAGIYSGLTASRFPLVVPRLLLVARFTGSPVEYEREFEMLISMTDENGLPGPVPSETRRLRMITGQSGEDVHCNATLEALNVTFVQPSWYQFSVRVDGELIDELPVNVSRSVRAW